MLFGGLDFFDIMVRLIVLLTAMPVHECAHGWVAYKLGDTTAERQGRLTLNPFHHIDPLGALSMLLVGFGWAKPVPVNPYYFRSNPRRGMALTALAGPGSNLLMALILCLACKLALVGAMAGAAEEVLAVLAQILLVMAQINITLAVFNLLPIEPLDGGQALGCALRQGMGPRAAGQVGFWLALAALVPMTAGALVLFWRQGNFTLLILCLGLGWRLTAMPAVKGKGKSE